MAVDQTKWRDQTVIAGFRAAGDAGVISDRIDRRRKPGNAPVSDESPSAGPLQCLTGGLPARLWHAIVNHSRPIHVLLLEMDLEGPDFVEMARQYRPAMQILLVAKHSDQSQPGALPVGAAVAQARELLKSQK